jgi:NmrA-like family
VYSALADTTGLSNEKYMYVYHFASKAHAINFARTEYPELMAKTSIIQVAGYLSNFLSFPGMKPEKNQETGAYIFSSPFPEGFRMPFVAAEEDTGPFTEALLKAPAGKNLLACRAEMTMDDIAVLWGETLGKKVELRDGTKMGMPEGLDEETMAFMREFAETGMWAVEFGYAGEKVDKTVIKPDQVSLRSRLSEG